MSKVKKVRKCVYVRMRERENYDLRASVSTPLTLWVGDENRMKEKSSFRHCTHQVFKSKGKGGR